MTDEPPAGEPAPVRQWLATAVEPSAQVLIDRVRRAIGVTHVAVMPDVHAAKDVCVGTAVATDGWLYPAAVGGDIGCGMWAVALDATADLARDPKHAGTLLRRIGKAVPTHRHHRARLADPPPAVADVALSHGSLTSAWRDVGRLQLGTLGGGNHFVELQSDGDDRLWVMIHTGSRAMGQAVRAHHVAVATVRSAGMMAARADTPAGRAYLHDQRWACDYAAANREAIGRAVTDVFRADFAVEADPATAIRCDHNHVRLERHFGRDVYVHRKGAMPADAGVAGVVPGSMGTASYHVVGRGCDLSLRTSAHGAGRAFSRSAARERFARTDLRRQMSGVWFDPRLADALREESPKAYKDVRAVVRAQGELVDVTRTLRPVLVYKGT